MTTSRVQESGSRNGINGFEVWNGKTQQYARACAGFLKRGVTSHVVVTWPSSASNSRLFVERQSTGRTCAYFLFNTLWSCVRARGEDEHKPSVQLKKRFCLNPRKTVVYERGVDWLSTASIHCTVKRGVRTEPPLRTRLLYEGLRTTHVVVARYTTYTSKAQNHWF